MSPCKFFLKPEGIECVRRVSGVTIHHTDRGTFCIIEINQQIITPGFRDDLRAVQPISMFDTIDRFAGTKSISIVFKGKRDRSVVRHSKPPPTGPSKMPLCAIVIAGRVANRIISVGSAAIRNQQIAPSGMGLPCRLSMHTRCLLRVNNDNFLLNDTTDGCKVSARPKNNIPIPRGN